MHDIARKARKTTTQELEKHVNIEHWRTEITQQRLQTQVEELHRNIRFFKQENEYIRCLVEQCRYSSEKTKVSKQLLPITYSGLTTAIKQFRAKYHIKQGIITTVTEMLRGSINIQQIAGKLLAFVEYWYRDSNSIITAYEPSASRTELSSNSVVFNVY
nr:PREDICTED: uncharacterized protein LOC105667617 [Linepithema humile]